VRQSKMKLQINPFESATAFLQLATITAQIGDAKNGPEGEDAAGPKIYFPRPIDSFLL
jgi:hypothetical protein